MSSADWNTDDLDFDCDGKLVIKNAKLARRLSRAIRADGKLLIDLNPCPTNKNCPCGIGPAPPPNDMCMCVAVGPHLSFPPQEGTD